MLSRCHSRWCDYHSIGGERCVVGSPPDGVSFAATHMYVLIARSRSDSPISMSRSIVSSVAKNLSVSTRSQRLVCFHSTLPLCGGWVSSKVYVAKKPRVVLWVYDLETLVNMFVLLRYATVKVCPVCASCCGIPSVAQTSPYCSNSCATTLETSALSDCNLLPGPTN